ncbi:hypothetical protein H072_4580 [Dactylellina haptotyla CBS 200.50]|uniref:ACB domain-containing protein n=1 Tax=Dactylellina haptotyla (strain CBS 200.50) TaxID=1284197 RepID=S8AK77_DACHA|nr:hypothetical protein H072_4580 [Dactylellina haptotyla CBS 200.50]
MADSVDRVFVHALNTVKKLPRSGSSRPSPEDRLKLYGLYKQSMEGNVDGVMARPTGMSDEDITEARKWDAWHEQKGLSKTEAKRRYITTVIDAMNRYATTTPDARELVAELEFVWDQIKSNQTSSSSSITQQPLQSTISSSATTTPRRQTLGGLSHSQNVSAAGLQIIPPMSPTEEAAGRFMNFPPVGMGVQTDDEDAVAAAGADDDDDDDDGDEHYETMDEFDENGLPKVAVISEPVTFMEATGSGSLVKNANLPQEDTSKRKHAKNMSSSQYTATKKSATAAAFSSGTSSPHTHTQQQSTGNQHYTRWKQRVEVALTKMTAEVAALREQLDVARTLNAGNVAITRGRLGWLRRWISWGVWMLVKHLVIDALLFGLLVVWMRKRGDRRFENLLGLIGGFLGDRLRRKADVRDVRTFVVA